MEVTYQYHPCKISVGNPISYVLQMKKTMAQRICILQGYEWN